MRTFLHMEQKFQKYLIISFLLHLIFFVVFMWGLPFIFETKPTENEAMVFEMVDASDFNNIKNQNPNPKKDESEITESKRAKNPDPQPEEEVKEEVKEEPKPEEPLPEKAPEIIPEKEKEKEPKKEKEKPKKEEKKKEEKKKEIVIPKDAKKKKPEKKPEKKPVKKEEDPLDKIMRELEKESEGQSTTSDVISKTSNAAEGKFAKGDNYDEDSPLSVTEISLIKKQIQDNYKVPVQAIGLKIEIILSLKLAEDGAVLDASVKNTVCPPASSDVCELVRENALRAVKKASPLQRLRPERYDVWRSFSLRFNAEGLM